jgi:RNA polymerase sigma-70 factor (ECF subfamily)
MFTKENLNKLYRYCYALCDDRTDAFDLLQASVEKCLKQPPKDIKALQGYAFRTIRNTFIDSVRSKKTRESEEFDETVHVALDHDIRSLESVLITQTELEVAWSKLFKIEREILFLWAVEGYSTSEVANLLDKPKNSILSIVHRMRARLINNRDTQLVDKKKL